MKPIKVLAATLILSVSAVGCATISEDECLAGNWEDIGFKDGERGQSRSRLADIGTECAKYGVTLDRTAYLRGFDEGIDRYCTPDRGYETGLLGNSVNRECAAGTFPGYVQGHADGFAEYEINRAYAELQDDWTDLEIEILDLEARLDLEELDVSERRRLRSRLRGLELERDDIRQDVRNMEYEFGWPRWRPDIEEDA